MHVTHGALNLTPSQLLIRPRTNQRPRPKPKAQYTILGPYPYTNSINKIRGCESLNDFISMSFFFL